MGAKGTLLQQAYKYISSGDLRAAATVFESLVDIDPVNIEAWEAYMQISITCNDLDNICDRVLQVTDINAVDRESILDYYYFLRQRKKLESVSYEMQTEIRLELVDHFSYPLKSNFLSANDYGEFLNFEQRLKLFLNRAIFVPYIVLLAISFSLLSRNNELGYWAALVLILIVLLGKLNHIFSMIKDNRISSSN